MPLKSGTSKATISANIAEIMRSWKETGKIGNSKPKTVKQAQAQAAAIAYDKARESARKKSRGAKRTQAWVAALSGRGD